MSVFTKSDVASLDLNVSERVVSLPVPPSFISANLSEAVIVIVGAVLSNVTLPEPLVTAVPAFPAVSAKAMLKLTAPDVSLAFAM
jgi:tRNA C32,U32 (ribose-2'-O)-methylase TrmJ